MHVGRLDVDTTGVLLFTTDGVLCHRLLGPGSCHAEKCYLATLRGGTSGLSRESITKLATGVQLPGGKKRMVRGIARNVGTVRHEPRVENLLVENRRQLCGIEDKVSGDVARKRNAEITESALVELTVSEGANHQVKHMLALVGRPLWKLHRASFCGIGVSGLEEGQCRELKREEEYLLYAAADANMGKTQASARNCIHEDCSEDASSGKSSANWL